MTKNGWVSVTKWVNWTLFTKHITFDRSKKDPVYGDPGAIIFILLYFHNFKQYSWSHYLPPKLAYYRIVDDDVLTQMSLSEHLYVQIVPGKSSPIYVQLR